MAGNRELTDRVYATLALIMAEKHPGTLWTVKEKDPATDPKTR